MRNMAEGEQQRPTRPRGVDGEMARTWVTCPRSPHYGRYPNHMLPAPHIVRHAPALALLVVSTLVDSTSTLYTFNLPWSLVCSALHPPLALRGLPLEVMFPLLNLARPLRLEVI